MAMPQMQYMGPPRPPQKPSSLYKVTGIIMIVLGAFGTIWAFISIGTTALTASMSTGAMSTIYDTPTLVFMYLHIAFSILTGSMLLGTGIGVVRARKWSRMLGVAYAVVSLLNTVGSTIVQLAIVQPRIYATLGASSAAPSLQAFTTASTLVGVVVAAIIPVGVLVLMLRSPARAELDL